MFPAPKFFCVVFALSAVTTKKLSTAVWTETFDRQFPTLGALV